MNYKKLIQYILKIKISIIDMFKEKCIIEEKEEIILQILFRDIEIDESLLLYSKINEKFIKELKNRTTKNEYEIELLKNYINKLTL